jgi:hypothetical protein
MQGDQSYCFPQLIAVLSFTCGYLVSSSPSEMRQFSFECCPLGQEISSMIHSLPYFGEWLVAHLLSAFAAFSVFTESLVLSLDPCLPPFYGASSVFCPRPLLSVFVYSSLFVFQFCLGGSVCTRASLVYVPGVDMGVPVLCGSHLFILSVDVQAGLELVVVAGRNGTNFSQFSVLWGGFPWARGSGCHGV